MSTPSGTEWSTDDFMSPSRLNRKTNWIGTAEEFVQINRTYGGMSAYVTTNASGVPGVSTDTAYRRNAADEAWIVDTSGIHDHSGDTETLGGSFASILHANVERLLWINEMCPVPTRFMQSFGGSSTVTSDLNTGYGSVLSTGAISLSTASLKLGGSGIGAKVDWGKPVKFLWDGQFSANLFCQARIGVGMEHVLDANQTTESMGMEMCDLVGTARNWDVVSAANGIRSSTATSSNCLQTSDTRYKLQHTPGVSIKFYVNDTLIVTKTANIPISGSSSSNILQISIKNAEAVDKVLRISRVSLVASTITQ